MISSIQCLFKQTIPAFIHCQSPCYLTFWREDSIQQCAAPQAGVFGALPPGIAGRVKKDAFRWHLKNNNCNGKCDVKVVQ